MRGATLLLRLLGDSGDAEDAIDKTTRKVRAFGKEEAQAQLDVATEKARAKIADATVKAQEFGRLAPTARLDVQIAGAEVELERARTRLDALSRQEATPRVTVQMGQAVAQIERLEMKLDGLRNRRIEVDVDERGMSTAERLLGKVGGAATLLGDGLGKIGFSAVGLTGNLNPATIVIAALGAALGTSLLAAVAALGSSLLAAALGAGALALAAGGALLTGLVFAVGAMKRFHEQAGTAGTAANALKTAAERLGSTLGKAVAEGADAAFRGIAEGVRLITPALRALTPMFTNIGRAVGDFAKEIAETLASPRVVGQVRALGDGLARMVSGPIADGASALLKIFLDLATAALPFLEEGLGAVAGWLQRIADRTADSQALRDTIGGLVDHLKSWVILGGQVGSGLLAFFKVAAPAGKLLVDELARGAAQLAEWISSPGGREAIRQFFEDVLPLARQLAEFVGKLVVYFLAFVQAVAPLLTPVVEFLGSMVTLSTQLVQGLGELAGAIGGALRDAAEAVGQAGGALGNKLAEGFSSAATFVGNAARTVAEGAVAAASAVASAATTAGRTLGEAVGTAWGATKSGVSSAARTVAEAAVTAARGVGTAASAAGRVLGEALGTAWSATKSVVASAGSTVAEAAVTAARGVGGAAAGAGRFLGGKVSDALRGTKDAIADAAEAVVRAAVRAVTGLAGRFFDAGKALIRALGDGIASMAEWAVGKAKGVLNAVTGLLPGSEPKDPASPLRGLHDRGRAIIGNLTAGLQAAAGALPAALRAELGATAQVAHLPLASPGSQTPAGPTMNTSVTMPTAPADADHAFLRQLVRQETEATLRRALVGAR